MLWPDSGVGRNAARVSAKAVSVLGMGRQVGERDRDLVSTPEIGGLSLRTARREGAWVLFLARFRHVIPCEPAKPLLAALGQCFVHPGPPPLQPQGECPWQADQTLFGAGWCAEASRQAEYLLEPAPSLAETGLPASRVFLGRSLGRSLGR